MLLYDSSGMVERPIPSPRRRSRSVTRRLANTLLAVAGTAVAALAIGGAEGLLRWLEPDYLVRTRGLFVFSSTYGWAGRPGAVAPMGGGRVTLDGRGYRGRGLPAPPRPSGGTRVVVLGDSVAFGYGVSDEQTFPHLLTIRDNGIEAGNLAVEGYGPGQELLVLRREGLREDPHVVVLAVCLRNDFADAVLPVALYDGVTPRPRFRLVGGSLALDDAPVRRSGAGRALQGLSDYSHLYNRLSSLLPRREEPEGADWRQRKQEALRDQDYVLRLTLALVLEMEDACRRRGIEFLVATFPNGLDYAMKVDLADRFHQGLKAEGVWLVEVGARFRALGLTPREVAIDRTGHLGPRGHAVASEILEREIASRVSTHPRRRASDPLRRVWF